MRSFPRCWVMPGGAVDRGESIVAAAVRELAEETGLSPARSAEAGGATGESPAFLAGWESCYPTCQERWAAAVSDGEGTRHHLVMFVVVRCRSDVELRLQPSECDAAVWLPLAHVDALLAESGAGFSDAVSDDTARQYAPAAGSPADAPVARWRGASARRLSERVCGGHRPWPRLRPQAFDEAPSESRRVPGDPIAARRRAAVVLAVEGAEVC